MIDKIIFEGPLNNLSMGNVSLNLLKAFKNKGIDILYIPIGNADISNFNVNDEFKAWLQNSANRFLKEYSRGIPHVKNWHLAQSHTWTGDKRLLLTYHETDSATAEELNTIKNINKVLFCGNYSEGIFRDVGAKNVGSFNLGFDQDSFQKLNKTYFTDGRIQFLLGAKIEMRKKTLQTLALWAKKYGKKSGESYKPGEQQFFMNCQITNPFYDIKIQENQINQALGGIRYSNIQFFPFLSRESFNDLLNATDIDLTGLSGGESWNLIPFTSTALSKWPIVLNCSGNRSWSTDLNSIQVQPSGKVSCVDNIHFHPNTPFNIGNFYCYSDQDAMDAMDKAVKLAKTPNLEGEKLREIFTYEKSVDSILAEIEKLQ